MNKLIRAVVIAAALPILTCGCPALRTPHPVTPGSTVPATGLDLETYNLLLGTKALIDTTKADLAANVFSSTVAPLVKVNLDYVIQAYNNLEAQYEPYHNEIVATGAASAAATTAVTSATPAVTSSVAQLKAVTGGK